MKEKGRPKFKSRSLHFPISAPEAHTKSDSFFAVSRAFDSERKPINRSLILIILPLL
jgi:hypothetical protein